MLLELPPSHVTQCYQSTWEAGLMTALFTVCVRMLQLSESTLPITCLSTTAVRTIQVRCCVRSHSVCLTYSLHLFLPCPSHPAVSIHHCSLLVNRYHKCPNGDTSCNTRYLTVYLYSNVGCMHVYGPYILLSFAWAYMICVCNAMYCIPYECLLCIVELRGGTSSLRGFLVEVRKFSDSSTFDGNLSHVGEFGIRSGYEGSTRLECEGVGIQ